MCDAAKKTRRQKFVAGLAQKVRDLEKQNPTLIIQDRKRLYERYAQLFNKYHNLRYHHDVLIQSLTGIRPSKPSLQRRR